ncbi:MAG: GldG family protein [Microgenomates group bacterium]|nr:GldG family protein [Microgenomates group bacterium]
MFKFIDQLKKSTIYLLLIFLFIIINFLMSAVSFRLDFSQGQAYTLSSATKKILKKLDQPVQIKFFVSSDLPTRFLPLKTETNELLNEYKKEGRGKISISIIDPKKDNKAQEEAQQAGIPEVRFSQLEKDKYAVANAYFGIAINYKDKKEILPQVTDVENLEYNLTAAIYKLSRKETPKIGILGQSQVFDINNDPLYTLKKVLSQQFEVDFPEKIDTNHQAFLIFDDNQKEYKQEEIDEIKKYLEKGKVIFFIDGVWVSEQLMTSEAKHNLFSLLKELGVGLEKNLILSSAAELVNFGYGNTRYFVPYPFWFRTNNFNKKISYFNNINQITYPWVSSLSLLKSENFKIEAIIKTNDQSWQEKQSTESASIVLDPQGIRKPNNNELKEFIVGADIKNKNGGEAIVIPCSRFVLERYLSQNSDNLELVLNMVNDLASEGALTGIKARAVNFYPLPELTENQKDIFKYLNTLLLPLLFAIYGILRINLRKD